MKHQNMTMYHEPRRVTDRAMLCDMLDLSCCCTLALHDEPWPYIVPMNFGYEWEEGSDTPTFYLHMATRGHRLSLIEKDPHVALNVSVFYDRHGKKAYRNENHDYRSVNAFGIISEITNEEEAIHALGRICVQSGRPNIVRIPSGERVRMRLFKVEADIVTGKAQYPISTREEVPMPEDV